MLPHDAAPGTQEVLHLRDRPGGPDPVRRNAHVPEGPEASIHVHIRDGPYRHPFDVVDGMGQARAHLAAADQAHGNGPPLGVPLLQFSDQFQGYLPFTSVRRPLYGPELLDG